MTSKGVDYLQNLNDRQKEAVLHTNGPLLILAGAGAGKTKTITHRMAHLISQGVPAREILAVTFTNKAAGEMRERVRRLLPEGRGTPFVSTFHSLGVRLLREFHAEAGIPRAFVIWDRDDSTRVVKRALQELDTEQWTPRSIVSTISRHKGEGTSIDEFQEKTRTFRDQTVVQVWRRYNEALAAEGGLDFDDLIVRTMNLLQKSKETRSLLQNRWSHLTIDEYQDTNRAQFEIAHQLTSAGRDICVVGDPDQLIYGWRGADSGHLLSFEKTYPGTRVVLLEQNYRSTRTILAAANSVISKNTRRYEKNLFTDNVTGDPIVLYGATNEVDEAWFIAQTAARLIESGTSACEIAVLYRENFQSRVLEEACLAFDIPYRVIGTRFFERKEVKDVLSYLRGAMNPHSAVDLSRIIGTPTRGIGKVTVQKIIDSITTQRTQGAELTWGSISFGEFPGAARSKIEGFAAIMRNVSHAITTLPASEAVRYTLEVSGMEAMFKEDTVEGPERLENIRELVNLSTRYDDMVPPTGIERLLEESALQSDQDEIPPGVGSPDREGERNAVSLMTVHASKGLEFDAVFVTGLEQGMFPSIRESDTSRDPEEERRLFYVALTRARKNLFLTYAAARLRYGSREFTLPSEFLEDIDPRLITPLSRENSDTTHEGLID